MAPTNSNAKAAKAAPAKTDDTKAQAAPAPDAADQEQVRPGTGENVTGPDPKAPEVISGDYPQEDVEGAAEADPAAHLLEGQSFYNPATVGSGTILPDGTYGDPLPDPQVQRANGDSDARLK